MSGADYRVCFRVLLDPSTPVSSLLEASTVAGVSKPVTVGSSEAASRAAELCRHSGCSVIAVVDGDGRLVKAVSYYRVAAKLLAEGDFNLSDIEGDVPAISMDAPIQRLIEEIILHGAPVIVVDRAGKPLYAADHRIISQLLQEEIDLEEIRGAD